MHKGFYIIHECLSILSSSVLQPAERSSLAIESNPTVFSLTVKLRKNKISTLPMHCRQSVIIQMFYGDYKKSIKFSWISYILRFWRLQRIGVSENLWINNSWQFFVFLNETFRNNVQTHCHLLTIATKDYSEHNFLDLLQFKLPKPLCTKISLIADRIFIDDGTGC